MPRFGGFCVGFGFQTFKELYERSKKASGRYKPSSKVQRPRSRIGNGKTVRKFGRPNWVVDGLSSIRRPSRFMRSKRAVVGGAMRMPAIAHGIAVRSINSN